MEASIAKYLLFATAAGGGSASKGILYGTTAPSDTDGNDGDYYYVRDVDAGDNLYHITAQYYKDNGSWQEITP